MVHGSDIKDLFDIRNREYARCKRFRTSELYETFKDAKALTRGLKDPNLCFVAITLELV